MINSDKTKDKKIFYICIYEIIKLMLEISESELNNVKYSRNDISDSWRNIHNDMKLIDGNYNYDSEFYLDKIVNNIKEGKLYKRKIINNILIEN